MRKYLLAAISVVGLFASPLAFADDTKPVAPTPVSSDDSNKVTCHPVIHEGDVVHKADCHTQKEWDRLRFQSQQSLRQWQQQSLTGPGQP